MKSGKFSLQTPLGLFDNNAIVLLVHSLPVYFLALIAQKPELFNSRKDNSMLLHKQISIITMGPIKPRKYALSPA